MPTSEVEILYYLDRSFSIVRKSRRRTLSVKLSAVKENKIYVNHGTSQKVILDFLMSKKDWLEKHLEQIDQIKKTEHRPSFQEGQLFPFLGEMKYLTLVDGDRKKIKLQIEDGFMTCYLPRAMAPEKVNPAFMQKYLINLYKSEASAYLISRCQYLSQELNLQPQKIKIQTAQSRWGSCNSNGVINLNWKLMVFAPSLIDYVIIHELCHLKHLNHSSDFWSLVEKYYPHYKDAQNFFKAEGHKLSSFLSPA